MMRNRNPMASGEMSNDAAIGGGRESDAERNGEQAGLRSWVRQLIADVQVLRRLPRVEIDLMYRETRGNDPFYARVVKEKYETCRRRHRRFPLVGAYTLGVPIARLPATFDEYFMAIEASGRRNVKKAGRLGYRFAQINYNDYLADIGEIRRSADTRQGPMPKEFLSAPVGRCTDPPSTSITHDWLYFGALKDDKLYAYAGCFVCGEVCILEHIYGHASHHSDGIVPMLIVGIAKHLIESRPSVRYFCYSSYFGAGVTMRRFQRKFLFMPHRVKWSLD
jgi:hypothetical protein